MKKRYQGSCHCRRIAFTAELDFSEGIRRCNCSFCLKFGYKKSFAKYPDVTITAGTEHLREYVAMPSSWPKGNINHYRCDHCGVSPFSRGFLEQMGQFWAVNVSCLDDATEEELAAAPVIYEDGKRDQQLQAPAITAYL